MKKGWDGQQVWHYRCISGTHPVPAPKHPSFQTLGRCPPVFPQKWLMSIKTFWKNDDAFHSCNFQFYSKTRKHSSRMHTTCLPTVCAFVATRCQYQWGAVKWGLMNKFQLVSSDGHQMSLVGGGVRAGGPICPRWVPTFLDWQNSMIFPWFFQVFLVNFQVFFHYF